MATDRPIADASVSYTVRMVGVLHSSCSGLRCVAKVEKIWWINTHDVLLVLVFSSFEDYGRYSVPQSFDARHIGAAPSESL